MSSPATNPSSPNYIKSLWPYVSPMISTALANLPVYYGFMAKSSIQMKEGFPKLHWVQLIKETLRSSPTVGLCVGLQIVSQHLFEKKIFNINPERASFTEKLLSALAVGAMSAPLYAAMNAQTMGKTVRYGLSHFSLKQFGAITTREGAFLMGLEMADPACELLKKRYSKETSDFLGSFITGVAGSLVGHPADTLLTLEQKKMRIERFSCLYRGATVRAIAVGAFSMSYHVIHKKVEALF